MTVSNVCLLSYINKLIVWHFIVSKTFSNSETLLQVNPQINHLFGKYFTLCLLIVWSGLYFCWFSITIGIQINGK